MRLADVSLLGTLLLAVIALPARAAPAKPVALGGVAELCALRSDDSLWCWGSRNVVGANFSAGTDRPTKVLDGVRRFGTGGGRAAAVLADGAVATWYWTGANGDELHVVRHPGITGAVDVAVANGGLAAIVLGDGGVVEWDLKRDPQGGAKAKTQPVPGLALATAVSCGFHQCCVIHGGGKVSCFEADPNDTALHAVGKLTNAKALSVGEMSVLVVDRAGKQFRFDDTKYEAKPVPAMQRLGSHACGIDRKGRAACSEGELDPANTRLLGKLGTGLRALTVGAEACAIDADDRIVCLDLRRAGNAPEPAPRFIVLP